MAETFYSALGVAADATADAIKAAYRDRVKESHPDVSDAPDAPREFKRLTTARDVLTDQDERARYDRLGHATYVSRHVETSVWSVADDGRAGSDGAGGAGAGRSERTRSRGGRRSARSESGHRSRGRRSEGGSSASNAGSRHRRSDVGGDDRSAWLGEDWDGPRDRGDRSGRASRSARGARWVGTPGWSEGSTGQHGEGAGSSQDGDGPSRGEAGRSHGPTDRTGDANRRPGRGEAAGDSPGPAGSPGASGAGADGDPGVAGQASSDGGRSRRDGTGGVGQPWQHASGAYRYSSGTATAESPSALWTLGKNLKALGPWLVIHVVLFLGAVAMAWYMYVGTSDVPALSAPAVAFGGLLVALIVVMSILHLISLLYA